MTSSVIEPATFRLVACVSELRYRVPAKKWYKMQTSYIQFAYIHFPLFLDEKWRESMPSNNVKEHLKADTTIHRSITPISKERDE
jgi:hypothetical protein